jgi:hypothetical protein
MLQSLFPTSELMPGIWNHGLINGDWINININEYCLLLNMETRIDIWELRIFGWVLVVILEIELWSSNTLRALVIILKNE